MMREGQILSDPDWWRRVRAVFRINTVLLMETVSPRVTPVTNRHQDKPVCSAIIVKLNSKK